ncbi:DNA ligase LigA-related protein [Priestia aryabhattai]|uniref:DNA ligase LigA-related protein n=1 Tax=Priestia aryabhattai TaxID=412384 RepID=UPI0027E53881|nr:hypothetical protein [Priestia aryabhattai]MCG0050749.1 hypothetical protein [Priestia aryabhattai]
MNEKIMELISRRRRQMLVHSFLYHQLNDSLIDDYTFDRWCKELVELQLKYSRESLQVVYANDFKDFDGSSGYNLPYNRSEIQTVGYRLLKIAAHYK